MGGTSFTSACAALALLVAGCSSDEPLGFGEAGTASSSSGGSICVPGATAQCACTDGSLGAQTCRADGSGFGSCSCEGSGGDGGDGGGASVGGRGGGGVCEPGAEEACYSGPDSTLGVGVCVAGTRTCAADGAEWGPCNGEVVPTNETCSTPGDDDCDGETNEEGADCSCAPGSQAPCYSGPPPTQGVGPCHGGTQQCKGDGTGYGPCVGEVTPVAETCNTAVDDDCDGEVNEGGLGCVCSPDVSEPCYDGPPGTLGVGPCVGGTHTCNDQGTAFGPCNGQVVPQQDLCATVLDEDCNGSPMPCVSVPTWSKDLGTSSLEEPIALAVDGGGNVVFGSSSGMLWKLDGSGNQLWSVALPAGVRGLAFTPNGNVLVTGYFSNFVDLGGNVLVSQGANDIYLLELDTAGAHVWSQSYGGPYGEVARAVAIDANGNILLVGEFFSETSFGAGTLPGFGNSDFFVAKLNPTGGHVWSKAFGSVSGNEQVIDVAIDTSGNVLLTGWLNGTVNFGGADLTSAGGEDVFIAKLAADGSHLWSQRYGSSQDQLAFDIASDANGNVVVTGYFFGNVDFGGGAMFAGSAETDVFVVKLTPAGAHTWSKRFGDGGYQTGLGITADPSGNVLFTGGYAGAPDFGGGPLAAPAVEKNFLVKLTAAGNHVWSYGFGDGNSQYGWAVATDIAGYVFQLGANTGTVDFGHGPLVSVGERDLTIAKLDP